MTSDLACISILDADATAREQLASLVHAAGWRPQCFASAREFLSRAQAQTPGCLILDVELPDSTGLELQRQLSSRCELPIIFCTASTDLSTTVKAMKAGALEFLSKPICTEDMLNAIEQAIHHSTEALANAQKLRPLQQRCARLSPREREVMALVVAGRLNKLIGADLGISEITVKAHRGNVMRKMDARSLADLVKMATLLAPATAQPLPARRPPLALPTYATVFAHLGKTLQPMGPAYA